MKRLFSAILITISALGLCMGTLVSAQTTPSSCVVIPANLGIGSENASVSDLQTFLRAEGFLNVNATGYFGALTSAAVSAFQASVGLPAVGVVGPLTRAAVQTASCPQTSVPSMGPPPTITNTNGTTTPSSTATTTNSSVATTTASSTDTSLPYKADTFFNWTPVWGLVTIGTTTGTLELAGSTDNNGAEAILPTSENWTDYRFTANVSVANGNVSLIGRYVDGNTFFSCSFSNNWVELDQTANGSTTVLESKSVNGILSNPTSVQTTSMAMDVKGNTIGCAGFGPEDNITYTVPGPMQLKGGIGVESWYSTPLADKLDLLSVQVTPL